MSEIWNPDTTPNFSAQEMACKCGCNRADMKQAFMNRLQSIRDQYGPMIITSGFRCENHPAEKSKKNPGAHAQGRAADIAVDNATQASKLHQFGNQIGMLGVGIATKQGFIHLDDGHDHAVRPATWGY
ncbi:MAG: YcbK family protein [Candidatus Puniceispirillaceae bacterium]